MKALNFLSLLFALLLSNSVTADTVYLEYDATCMDRFEYQYSNSAPGFNHIVYQVVITDQQKIILEVGIENRVNQRARPANVKTCADLVMNERFVRQINKGETQLYMVRRSGNEYNVSPVGLATYSQITPSLIGFSSSDYVFAYNFNQAATGKNIATAESEAKVYYNGTVSFECPKKYQFTKILNRAGKNYTEMTLIPEIGVIEEKTGFNQTDAENNKLQLISINNIPLQNYLTTFCQNKANNLQPQGVFYSMNKGAAYSGSNPIADLESGKTSTTPAIPTTPSTTPTTPVQPTTSTPVVTTQPTCRVYKDIDKGLYINWDTGQLANGECGGNNFRNGIMLNRTETTTTPATSVSPAVVTPTAPVVTTVVPSDCPEMSSPGYHVVQRNETLSSIARLYNSSISELTRLNNISNPNKT